MIYRNRDTGELVSRDYLISQHPLTCFPETWNDDTLDFLNVDPVVQTEPPVPGPTQYVEMTGAEFVQSEGVWQVSWAIRDITDPDRLAELLQDAKAAKRARITERHERLSTAGLPYDFGAPYGTLTIQTRKAPYDDRDNLQTILMVANDYISGALPGAGADEPFRPFRTAENVNVPMTAAQIKAMCLNVQSRLGALRERSFDLKDQVETAANFDELEAIDVEGDWLAD